MTQDSSHMTQQLTPSHDMMSSPSLTAFSSAHTKPCDWAPRVNSKDDITKELLFLVATYLLHTLVHSRVPIGAQESSHMKSLEPKHQL